MKLDIRAFAWACGLVWGAGLTLLTWRIIAFDGPRLEPTWLRHVYRGYSLTFVGAPVAHSTGLQFRAAEPSVARENTMKRTS